MNYTELTYFCSERRKLFPFSVVNSCHLNISSDDERSSTFQNIVLSWNFINSTADVGARVV
jgi:hypothetical protein